MKLIAIVDKEWGIGKDGEQNFRIPEDTKAFRETTTGGIVIMGRKTQEALPKGAPLKNRVNLVLTTGAHRLPKGFIACRNLQEVFDQVSAYPDRQPYVIGGQQVYEELLPYCRGAHITQVDAVKEHDRTMPDLSTQSGWRLVEEAPWETYDDLRYCFLEYVNSVPKAWTGKQRTDACQEHPASETGEPGAPEEAQQRPTDPPAGEFWF